MSSYKALLITRMFFEKKLSKVKSFKMVLLLCIRSILRIEQKKKEILPCVYF